MATLRKLFLPVIVGAAAYYALFGGEYSLFEVRAARDSIEHERLVLEDVREEVRSLAARADSIQNDAATLERIARERYGMIRDGEVLYRFVDESEEDVAGEPVER